MESDIRKHSGFKYIRQIHSAVPNEPTALADVYSVLEAFNVTCPARQHCLKKILCAGIRGKGSQLQDLKEAVDAMSRAIQLQEIREAIPIEK